jgi:hypothetical protein
LATVTPAIVPFFLVLLLCGQAWAEPVPSQELPSDAELPHYRLGFSAEALEALFSRYGLRAERTFHRAHALWMSAGWEDGSSDTPLLLRVGYHLWCSGEGLDGPYVGPSVGIRFSAQDFGGFVAGLEAGYQRIWGGLLLAVGAGVEFLQPWEVAPRLRVAVGYAWM